MQLVVCGVRPVQLEGTEQSLGLRAHAPQGMCDNLITHVKKVLVTQQKDGHSPVRMIVPVLLEESRREMMGGLRSFTAVDTCAAVATGDLQKEL